jgi:Putative auto-transporter adhesin, head GIN domain
MRPLILLLPVLLVSECNMGSCGDCVRMGGEGPEIKGSGTLKTETRTVGNFTAIRLSEIAGRLEIERTGTAGLTVTADDNLVSKFTSEVRDGTLYLSLEKGNKIYGKRPAYKITVGDLRELGIEGAATIEATKLDGPALTISIAGAAAGTVAGRSDELTISLAGAATLNAAELKAKRGKVSVAGAGVVTVNVSDELEANVDGVGIVWYIGSPKLTSNVSGLGAVKKK